MGEHDCETIARAHLVSLRWASGPSSLRAEPPRYRLRRIALRATGRGQAFSRLFVVHRTTFAEGDARGGSERSDEGDERPHLTELNPSVIRRLWRRDSERLCRPVVHRATVSRA